MDYFVKISIPAVGGTHAGDKTHADIIKETLVSKLEEILPPNIKAEVFTGHVANDQPRIGTCVSNGLRDGIYTNLPPEVLPIVTVAEIDSEDDLADPEFQDEYPERVEEAEEHELVTKSHALTEL